MDSQNSPLTPEQQALVNQLTASLNPIQTAWLAGYLSGVNSFNASLALLQAPLGAAAAVPAAGAPAAVAEGPSLTILFGSQTGNCEGVAKLLAERAQQAGVPATLKDMGSYKGTQLKKESLVLIIVSTHGEGDPPDTVEELHALLQSKRAPKLADLKYGVLALGDSSYEHYCQTGVDFDVRLAELGAERLLDRVDCDLDYDDDADAWIAAALEKVAALAPTAAAAGPGVSLAAGASASAYDRRNPFPAPILANINLSGRGSGKENRHVELSLEDSGLTYQPGDSLGVFPMNNPELVDEIVAAAKLDPEAAVNTGDLAALVAGDKDKLRTYIDGRELIDLLIDHPATVAAQQLVDCLRRLPARQYSIASSLDAYPDEVHLLIATVRYDAHGRAREGVCSTYFSDRVSDETLVPVYVHENNNFRMPADGNQPMIMIGPGTGVAPFRTFLQQRELVGATGRNWLFFGDQHFRTDFTYQTEWQQYLADGLLTRLDVAFSRDQKDKVYVQHRMREQSAQFYSWLEEGAAVYVCGDETQMAKDVHAALLEIIQKEGGKSADAAEEYVRELQHQKRYQRDVY
jgi:sulfite reductase (NADPH) flavoprotein alpha-component